MRTERRMKLFETFVHDQNSFWIKSRTGEEFPQVQLRKLSQVLEIAW